MMGERAVRQEALLYGFSLEDHVPADHLLRSIDGFVELSEHPAPARAVLQRHRTSSIDPELMIRMLFVGYCCGIRSERRLCQEVHLNLAYRWFCRLGLTDAGAGPFDILQEPPWPLPRQRLLRTLFEASVRRCMAEGVVGGEGFAVDASMVRADAIGSVGLPDGRNWIPPRRTRAVGRVPGRAGRCRVRRCDRCRTEVHLAHRSRGALDRGGRRPGLLRLLRQLPHRPQARRHRGRGGHHRRAPGRGWRGQDDARRAPQAVRSEPERLVADTGYGSAAMLGWLVHEQGIEPHIPVFDKSKRTDGTFSRDDFTLRRRRAMSTLPGRANTLTTTGSLMNDDHDLLSGEQVYDCRPAH